VAKYCLEIKPSAAKELDALDDALFARIDRKIVVLAENPRPPGCKKLRGVQGPLAHPRGRLARFVPIDDAARRVSITRVAHRREVYES